MTVLFLEDWDKHPGAIVDTRTTNQSFLRLAGLFKHMGVRNHAFPLQLLNRELQGIDPHREDLDFETMAAIAIECKQNLFYFAREIIRDPNGGPLNPICFRANRGNIATFWLFLNHVTTIVQILRQQGKSFTADCISIWVMNLASRNAYINLLSKDTDLRSKNLVRLKALDEEMPFYLRQRTKNDIANTEEYRVSSLKNGLLGYVPKSSPKQALNVGRGSTAAINMVDEFPFITNIGISLPSMFAAATAARDIAKSKGEPYGNLIYSTAGKRDDRDGKYAYNMLSNSALWTEKFYDCDNAEDLESKIRRNSPKGEFRVYAPFIHRQLGFTDEWLKKKMEEAESSGDDALRDYLGVWTSGSNTSPLPTELATAIRDSVIVDFHTEITEPYGYITRWYIPGEYMDGKMRSSKFIMGLDTSDAAGGDDIGMTLRDVKTGAVVAAGNYNETNLITFSEFLADFLVRYTNVTLIVERRSTGAMIIDYLLLILPSKGIDPFLRLYNKCIQEADMDPDRYKEILKPLFAKNQEMYVKYKKTFGFATSATGSTSRSELYSTTLLSAAKYTGDRVHDLKTIDQILGLEIKNGRVDHSDGEHDDLCISWLLSYWLIIRGKNLHTYGISVKDMMTDNAKSQQDNTPATAYDNHYQQGIKNQIEIVAEQIKTERDPYLVEILERRLRSIAAKLDKNESQHISIDGLIAELREFRQQNTRRYR